MTHEASESEDWQSSIMGIGILEFVDLDEQDRFINRINPFLDENDQMYRLHDRDTHPRFPTVQTDLTRKVHLPDGYGEIFDEVNLQTVIDTNQLARVLLYGSVDTSSFVDKRREMYDDSHRQLQLENSGLDVLYAAEGELNNFLRDEVGAGFITEQATQWTIRDELNHPGFWIYDLSDSAFDSVDDFRVRRRDGTLFLGTGDNEEPETGVTEYADGRCATTGDGRDYFLTPLGSFPFRFIFLRFQKREPLERPSGWNLGDPDDGIPGDFGAGFAPLARSYTSLVWSLDSYFGLTDHTPNHVLGESPDVVAMRDTEKAVALDELYQGNRKLDEFWLERREQFESIKATRRRYGGFATDEGSVVQSLILAATEIEALCEERVERLDQQYERLIDRVRSNLDANVGVVGKQLSIVLFALTLANIVIQFPSIVSSPAPYLIGGLVALILLAALLLLFWPSLKRWVSRIGFSA